MNPEQDNLLDAFTAIRHGEFERAFECADSEVKTDLDNFWGWYLATVSLGFLDRRPAFLHYLQRAELLNAGSPYVIYLKAYTHLWKADLESALMEWTKLVDIPEGWLAKELIEKARKGAKLADRAAKGDISAFIVIPDFMEGISQPEQQLLTKNTEHVTQARPPVKEEPAKKQENISEIKSRTSGNLYRNFIIVFLAVIMAGAGYILKNPVLTYINSLRNTEKENPWKNFKIDEWAALVHPQKKEAVKYIYQSKDKLIDDFEQAKNRLSEKKYNQTRFLLQRILYSNADFKTKEKSKIFLGFIPDPDYQDFSDPVFPDKILENPEFYADCLVLWQGSVLKIREVDRGREIGLLVKDAKTEYLVDSFLQTSERKSNWLPFTDFQKKKELVENKPQAIVYGKFKGIIGKQKKIYLELVQLWM